MLNNNLKPGLKNLMFKTVHNSPASAGKRKNMLNSGIIQKETNKQDTLNEDLNHIVKEKIQ